LIQICSKEMANTIAKSCTVQTKVARFNRPALSCLSFFFLYFVFRKEK
jgi:hypothetical protein